MCKCLGIDTSNYTTSAALYDGAGGITKSKKMPLPVKPGEKGLRQSDAVFHHTVRLPQVINSLFNDNIGSIEAVGVSNAPTAEQGSYMPCFLAGVSVAKSVSEILKIPYFEFSHQAGHIAAVIASTKRFELLEREFIALHLSGGTTQALLVKPDRDKIFNIKLAAASLDLKAGQVIDRAGVMLGLGFPCGAELDRLSLSSDREFKIKPSVRGADCSLSGIENKFKQMFENGESREDIAKFTVMSVTAAVDAMLTAVLKEKSGLPVLFSGGVSSNTLMRSRFAEKYDCIFAAPEYSADNAAGTAFLTHLKSKG